MQKKYVDIHKHVRGQVSNFQDSKVARLLSFSINAIDMKCLDCHKNDLYTVGIHPWDLSLTTYKEDLEIIKEVLRRDSCLGLGEVGFDRLKNFDQNLQMQAFFDQIDLAKKIGKNLIVCHVVRAYDLLSYSLKKSDFRGSVIIHGYSGNHKITEQLLKNKSIYFGLGESLFKDNSKLIDALTYLPINRIFFETDDSDRNISDVYQKYFERMSLCSVNEREAVIEDCYERFQKLVNFTDKKAPNR